MSQLKVSSSFAQYAGVLFGGFTMVVVLFVLLVIQTMDLFLVVFFLINCVVFTFYVNTAKVMVNNEAIIIKRFFRQPKQYKRDSIIKVEKVYYQIHRIRFQGGDSAYFIAPLFEYLQEQNYQGYITRKIIDWSED